MSFKYWTMKEINYLKENYATTPTEKIAEKLNRTKAAIRAMARKHKLYKNELETVTYVVYKNDNYIAEGNSRELGKLLGVKGKTITQYCSIRGKENLPYENYRVDEI